MRNTERANIPGFSWPGGRLDDPTKTPRQMAVKELEEETGIKADPAKLILWDHGFSPYVSPKTHIAYPLTMFICTEYEGEISGPQDPTEPIAEAQWAPIFNLPTPLAPRTEEFIRAGYDYLQAQRTLNSKLGNRTAKNNNRYLPER